MSSLSRTLYASDVPEDNLDLRLALPETQAPTSHAPFYNTWDVFHAVQSIKLAMMASAALSGSSSEVKRHRSSVARSKPDDVESGGLDYIRLVDVLLPDVLLAPASFCAADSSWGSRGEAMGGPGSGTGSLSFSRVYGRASRLSRRLIAPGAFSSNLYPVRKVVVDEKAAVTAVRNTPGLSSTRPPEESASVLGVIQKNAEPEASEPFPFRPNPSSVLTFVNLLLPTEVVKEMVPIVDPRLLESWSTFFVLEVAGSSVRKKMGRGISIVVLAVEDLKANEGQEEPETVMQKSFIEVPVCYPAVLERLTGDAFHPAAAQEVASSSLRLISFIFSVRPKPWSRPQDTTDKGHELKSRIASEGSARTARANDWSRTQLSALKLSTEARHLEMMMAQKLTLLVSVPPSAALSKGPSAHPRSTFSLEALLLEMWLTEARETEGYCSALARQAGRRLLLMARCEHDQSEPFDHVHNIDKVTRLLGQMSPALKGIQGSIDLSSMVNPSSFFSVMIRSFAHEKSISSLSHVALHVTPLNPSSSRSRFFLTSLDDPQANPGSPHSYMISGSKDKNLQTPSGFVSEARFSFEDGAESDECYLRASRPNLPCSPLPALLLTPVFIDPDTTSSAVHPHLRQGRKEAQDQAKVPANHDQTILRAPLQVANHPAISVIVDARRLIDTSDISPSIFIR
jgi:hypothetical protein